MIGLHDSLQAARAQIGPARLQPRLPCRSVDGAVLRVHRLRGVVHAIKLELTCVEKGSAGVTGFGAAGNVGLGHDGDEGADGRVGARGVVGRGSRI